jgi:MFS transporter, DHA1 family, inner membrane transport protein
MAATATSGGARQHRTPNSMGRVRSGRLALAALGLAAFTVGTSELVVVGILDPIADDAGVSISTAGEWLAGD